MNGVEGTIFTLMAAYVVFIDTAGSVLVVVGGGGCAPGCLGGHRQERGLGKEEAEGKAAGGWGRGERGEPGAWGEGGRNNIVAGAHQVLAVSPNKKEESATLGGGGREPPPAPALQPLPVNSYSATVLLKTRSIWGLPSALVYSESPHPFVPLVICEMWLPLGSAVAGLSFPFLKA